MYEADLIWIVLDVKFGKLNWHWLGSKVGNWDVYHESMQIICWSWKLIEVIFMTYAVDYPLCVLSDINYGNVDNGLIEEHALFY